jgi:hypothetical protein
MRQNQQYHAPTNVQNVFGTQKNTVWYYILCGAIELQQITGSTVASKSQ